jgi:hypothetical protein
MINGFYSNGTFNQVEQNKMIYLVKMTNDFFSQIERSMLTWASHCYALPITINWQKENKGLHLKTLLFSYIYICRIQILQKIAQLLSKGRFN